MSKASAARRAGPREVAYVTLPHHRVSATARPRRRETIRQFVARTGWEARGLPVVCARRVGTELQPVLRAEWDKRIKPSDELVFVAMPRGGGAQAGGSRQIGALVAMIALMALATALTGPGGAIATSQIGTALGGTGLKIVSAVIVAGGAALVSHFLSPKAGAEDRSEKDPLSVSFGGNQARPQQPIPVHYGRLKFFPDFASAPWTDFRGRDQVFHGLYSLGVGEFEIEEIGFGTTPVWTASGGTSPDFPSFRHEVVGPDEPVTLFPSNVAVSPDVSGQELQNVGEYIGPFIVNSPGTVGKRLAIDLVWPGGGHWTSSSGRVDPVTTTVRVQYRYVDESGVPINATWVTAANLSFRFLSKVSVRKTAMIDLPTSGRVQVRAARTNALITDNGTNAIVWAGARLYLEGDETRPHVTLMAMEAVSDKSLSAYGSQQIYVIATRKIPVWTGTTWEDQATQNPIWAAIDLWHNSEYGGGQSRDKIDLPALAAMAAEADARGDTFNHRFTEEMTVLEGLEAILRPLLAQPVYVWDRLTVIRDADERVTPRLMLTDFEIIRGSLSLDYMLQDEQSSDGVIVEYLEEETWLRAEVSSSGSVADLSHPSRIQAPGVTNRRQATLLARYLAASNRYRRVMASMEIEAEGKLLRRGDLVVVQTELPQTWGQAFRIDDFDVATRSLTFHEEADWTGGPNFYVSIRTPTGLPFGPVLVAQGASADIAIIDSVDLATVQTQHGLTLSEVLTRSDVSERPTAAFSAGELRSFEGLVTRIGNAGEGRFTLDLVRDQPEMYEIDDSDVPPATDPPALLLPAVPGTITGINAQLETSGLTLTLMASWQPDPASETYTAQTSLIAEDDVDEDEREWTTVYPAGYDATFQASGFGFNDVLLRIRGTSAQGVIGPWTQVTVTAPAPPSTLEELGFSVRMEDILDGSISGTKFASGIQPVSIVAALPSPTGYAGPSVVFNTTDGKLYRYVSGAWTAAVAAGDMTGQLTNAQLADIAAAKITGQLTDAQIAAIAAAKLTGAITGTQITDGAISTAKLAANAVTAGKIAADTITSNEIAANAITSTELNAGAVIAGKIATDAVTAGTIAAGAVTTAKLAAGAVTANELAANAVIAGKVAAGAISTDQLAANAVTAAKMAVGTITAASGIIADAAIGSAKIIDASVSTLKIAGNAVTIPSGVNPADVTSGISNSHSTPTTVATLTFTTTDSAPCLIMFSANVRTDTASGIYMYIDVDGTMLTYLDPGFGGIGRSAALVPGYNPCVWTFLPTLPAGAHTVTVKVVMTSSIRHVVDMVLSATTMLR